MTHYTIDDIRQYILTHDTNKECELLSTEYKNSSTPLLLKCNLCGKIFERDFNHIRRNRFRCVECGHKISAMKRKGQFKYPIEDIQKEIANDGYEIVGDYVNANVNVLCKCSQGHYFNFKYLNYKNGTSRCPYCKRIDQLKTKDYKKPGVRVTLQDFLREQLKPWKTACLKNSNYICDIDKENTGNLDVHHLVNFTDILQETLLELNLPFYKNCSEYTPEEILQIIELFKEKHTVDVGVVISQKYHILFHSIYGHQNNTKEQYEKFKYVMQNHLL